MSAVSVKRASGKQFSRFGVKPEMEQNLEPAYPTIGSFFADSPFVDRFQNGEPPVDVFIPIMHVNELWRANLLSIYREIPVNRLILGNAGCTDETLAIAQEFPRVVVLDHRELKSLGFSIRKMIEAVETDWFIYLHSDVCLPENWFDTMRRHQGEYDFFECRQNITVFLEDPLPMEDWRAYSGSQMGRKQAFEAILPMVDDDYLYRGEDVVFAELLRKHGKRYGKVAETWHYHQHLPRRTQQTQFERKIQVSYNVTATRAEAVRSANMQARAFVKYLDPRIEFVVPVREQVRQLIDLGETTWPDFLKWTAEVRPDWVQPLRRSIFRRRVRVLRDALMQSAYGMKAFARGIRQLLLPRGSD